MCADLLGVLLASLTVASTEVTEFAERTFGALSGGERARVALDLRHQDVVPRVVAGGRPRACGPPDEVLTTDLRTEIYQREVEVIAHPRSGAPLVVPVRQPHMGRCVVPPSA